MLSKKNSEALENFSESWRLKVVAFGRTPAVVLCITVPPLPAVVLVLIALFVTGANALSVHLFRYGLGHDVQRAGYGIRALFRH